MRGLKFVFAAGVVQVGADCGPHRLKSGSLRCRRYKPFERLGVDFVSVIHREALESRRSRRNATAGWLHCSSSRPAWRRSREPVSASTATTWAPKIPVTNEPVAGSWIFASAKGLAGRISAADCADVYGVGGIGIEKADAGAVVVGEGTIGRLRGGAIAEELSGWRSVGKHQSAPDGGMVEAEPVAELVREKRFEIVGALALRSGESGGSCVGGLVCRCGIGCRHRGFGRRRRRGRWCQWKRRGHLR